MKPAAPPGKLREGLPQLASKFQPHRGSCGENAAGVTSSYVYVSHHHHMHMCHIIICRMRRGQETRLFGQGLQGFRVCRVCRLSDGIVAGCLRPNAPITGQVVPRCLQAHTLYTLSVHTLSAHTLSLRAHTLCAGINHIRHPANACHVFIGYVSHHHMSYVCVT